jgi:hypothetical protein
VRVSPHPTPKPVFFNTTPRSCHQPAAPLQPARLVCPCVVCASRDETISEPHNATTNYRAEPLQPTGTALCYLTIPTVWGIWGSGRISFRRALQL